MQAIRVYLVRHGDAEKAAAGGDHARRLTAGGRERFHALAVGLKDRLAPARVLSSPLARAQETAEVLSVVAGAPVEVEDALAPAGHPSARSDRACADGSTSGQSILSLAARAGPGTALVGHNPEMAEAIAIAAGRGMKVRPGAIAAVDLTAGAVALAWIEAPEEG